MKLNRFLSLILSVVLIISALSGISYANDAALGMEVSEMPMLPEVTEEEPETTVDENAVVYGKDSLEFLNALNIIKVDEITLGENIKRADFLKLMAIIGGYGTDKGSTQVFTDLPLDDEREPYVRALYNVGIIATDANKNIYPDAEIAMQEAAAIAVKVTGYSLVAEAKGGYPFGYFNVAKNNGILKGLPVSAYEVVTVGMAVKLIENTLKADLMVQSFGADSAFYEYKGANLLAQIFGIYTYKNIVKGVDISRLSGANDLLQFTMDIGGNVIDASDISDAHSWLGYNVIAYYTNERGDIPRLKFLQKTIFNNETVIDFDDVISYSGGKIKAYDENGKEKSYSCSEYLPLIYNSVAAKEPFSQNMIDSLRNAGKNGVIRILDNTGDREPDVVFADIYESYVVSFADTNDNIVYDRYDNTKSTVVDVTSSEDYAVLYKADGEEGDLTDVSVDDVIAIFDSSIYKANEQGKKIVRVVNNVVSGTVSSTKKNGDIIIVDGVEYDVLAKAKAKFGHILTPGNDVTLKLDLNDKVVWVQQGASDLRYGFISALHAGEAGLSSEIVLKIYAVDNGRLDVYNVAENIIIDGHKYASNEGTLIEKRLNAASDAVDSGSLSNSSLIRFAITSDAKVKIIDTVLEKGANRDSGFTKATRAFVKDDATSNDTLFIEPCTLNSYKDFNQVIGETTILDKAAMILIHPDVKDASSADLQDVKKYKYVGIKSVLKADKDYTGANSNFPLLYGVYDNASVYISKFACLNGEATVSGELSVNSPTYVYDSNYDIYDEENDKAIKMMCLIGPSGEKIEVIVEEPDNIKSFSGNVIYSINDFKQGDMVVYTADSSGKLTNINSVYSPTDAKITDLADLKVGGFTNSDKLDVKYAFVYDKFDGGLIVYEDISEADFHNPDYKLFDANGDPKQGTMKIFKFADDRATAPIYTYTTGRGTEKAIKGLSQFGIKTYKDVGDDCSRLAIYYYVTSPRAIYEIDEM